MSKRIIEDFEKVIASSTDDLAHKLGIHFDSAEEIQSTMRKELENLLYNYAMIEKKKEVNNEY